MFFGLVAFILYLWFFVGFDGLFDILSKLNVYEYILYFSLAIAALFLAIIFDSMSWHGLLTSLDVKIKLRKIIIYNWVGNFIELILPSATIGGEIARIALVQRKTQHDMGIAAATVVGSRLISTLVYSGGLLVGFTLLLFTHKLPIYIITPLILVIIGTAGIIAVVFIVAFKEGATEKIVKVSLWFAKRTIKNPDKLERLKQKINNTFLSFSTSFRTFKDRPRFLVKPVIFSVISWLFYLIVYLMIFYSLNFTSISMIDLATIYSIVTTVETITAGFPVGAVEVTMINLFSIYGIPIAIAGAATTLTRLLTFWFQILVGYPLIEWMGAKSLLKGSVKKESIPQMK
jgi:glycosyltransferase 2 family protein